MDTSVAGDLAGRCFHGGGHPNDAKPFPFSKPMVRAMKETLSLLACLISLIHGLDARAEGDPEGLVNQASTSSLPQGAGLASRIGAGDQIGDHPDVVFHEDFEEGRFQDRWDEVRNDRNEVLSIVRLEADAGGQTGSDPADSVDLGRSLKVTATLGRNTGGGMTKWFNSSDRIYIRFYVRFDKDCDYVHHFCTLRANLAISGGDAWSGFGGAGELPDGSRRFSTALEPWGDWGRLRPPGRWNLYSYWHEMSGSPDGRYWGNAFRPAMQPDIEKGRWICAEFMLDHNTPGESDGEQAFWIDGKLVGHWKGINWRTSNRLMANAFTLESYVTDRWTKQRTNVVYFDEVVIARKYVGPRVTRVR